MFLRKYVHSVLVILVAGLVLQACNKDNNINSNGDNQDTTSVFSRYIESAKLESSILQRTIKYSVYLPNGYDNDTQRYPVTYMLHGYGDDETSWSKWGDLKRQTDRHTSSGNAIPMIYIMPQANNSYYVNRWNGKYNYMDMIVNELVPLIDSLYRTNSDRTQRATLGYSMGGYGALILANKHPDIFSVAVPLSMSFRSDTQYMAEPQSVFDHQWASNFGGVGLTGEARLTEYFKQHSPFHFFKNSQPQQPYVKYYFDCGDDEESLTYTANDLHNLMREEQIPHEFRIRNGGHNWYCWHDALGDALKYISNSFKSIEESVEEEITANIDSELPGMLKSIFIPSINDSCYIYTPSEYQTSNKKYATIYFIHNGSNSRISDLHKVLSIIESNVSSGDIPSTIVVEIPAISTTSALEITEDIIPIIENEFRTVYGKKGKVIVGNLAGGALAFELSQIYADSISTCILLNAQLKENNLNPNKDIFYHIDLTDKSQNYRTNSTLYSNIRSANGNYQYRVRKGTDIYSSMFNGFDQSLMQIGNNIEKPKE